MSTAVHNTPVSSHPYTPSRYGLHARSNSHDDSPPSSPRARRNTCEVTEQGSTSRMHIDDTPHAGPSSPKSHSRRYKSDQRPTRSAAYISIQEYCTRIRTSAAFNTSFSDSDKDTLPLPTVSPSSSRSDISSVLSRMLAPSTPASRWSSLLSPSLRQAIARCSDSQSFWLSLYFVLNLSLTLYNKYVLVSFPYPYTLTTVHALCGSLGGGLLLRNGAFQPKRLREGDYLVLVAFSVLYSINIAISNVSLRLVTVPVCSTTFHFKVMSFNSVTDASSHSRSCPDFYGHVVLVPLQ